MKPNDVNSAGIQLAQQEIVDVSTEARALEWANRFGVSVDDLRVAVEAVGSMPAAVKYFVHSNQRVGYGRIKARSRSPGVGRLNPRPAGRYVTNREERADAQQATAIVPCPFCFSADVERRFMQSDGRHWPGCVTCKQSRSMDEWTRLVRKLRGGP